VQVAPIKPTLKPPGTERLKLHYEELLSYFGFELNLRRYSVDDATAASMIANVAFVYSSVRCIVPPLSPPPILSVFRRLS